MYIKLNSSNVGTIILFLGLKPNLNYFLKNDSLY